MARNVTPQPASLRNIEVRTHLKPHLAQVSAFIDKLLGRPPAGDQDMGVHKKAGLCPPELALEELMKFRQSHDRMIPGAPSTGLPDTWLNSVQC